MFHPLEAPVRDLSCGRWPVTTRGDRKLSIFLVETDKLYVRVRNWYCSPQGAMHASLGFRPQGGQTATSPRSSTFEERVPLFPLARRLGGRHGLSSSRRCGRSARSPELPGAQLATPTVNTLIVFQKQETEEDYKIFFG